VVDPLAVYVERLPHCRECSQPAPFDVFVDLSTGERVERRLLRACVVPDPFGRVASYSLVVGAT